MKILAIWRITNESWPQSVLIVLVTIHHQYPLKKWNISQHLQERRSKWSVWSPPGGLVTRGLNRRSAKLGFPLGFGSDVLHDLGKSPHCSTLLCPFLHFVCKDLQICKICKKDLEWDSSHLAPNGSSGKSDTWAVTPGSLHNKWREAGTLGGESVVLYQIRTCALKVFITLHQPEQDGSFSSSDRIACDSHLNRLTLSLRMFVV